MSVLKVNQIQTANGVIMANLNSSGANIGFQLASSLAPAFSVYLSADQSITSSTFTKIAFDTKVFDTNNNFASNRFTPTVAGYYQFNAAINPSSSTTYTIVRLYKNGSVIYNGGAGNNITNSPSALSALTYANGSSDYFEIYGYLTGTSPLVASTTYSTYWQGFLARSA